ncbi:type II secretion system F family protein [Nocardia sp. NPDC057353]|uniref:type II secretion system F family protein n=1 Tax=Nocardia sp. NPDC057353 TaxID=3346104 RepID=UPI00363E9E7C
MSAGFALLALAMLVVPPPVARRRLAALGFGGAPRSTGVRLVPGRWFPVESAASPRTSRRSERGGIVEAGCLLATAAAALLGIGACIATGILAGTVVLRHRRSRADRTRRTGSADLLDALELVVAELRVGAHPGAAAETVATDGRGEAARAFAVAAGRSRLGGSAADGLEHPTSPLALELTRIATAWRIAEQHGLALGELITAARMDLRSRLRFRARTEAALAGARATATVLAALPALGIALGHLMGAAPLTVLLGSGAGTILLPLGAAFACAGLLWTDAITRSVLP